MRMSHVEFDTVLLIVGMGIMTLVHDHSPAKLWIPLYVTLLALFPHPSSNYLVHSRTQSV
jgi:hypothetical protein